MADPSLLVSEKRTRSQKLNIDQDEVDSKIVSVINSYPYSYVSLCAEKKIDGK